MDDSPKAGLDPHSSGISLLQLFDGNDTVYVFDVYKMEWHGFIDCFYEKNLVAHYGIFEIKHLTSTGYPNLNIGCSMLLSILVDRAERSPFIPLDEAEEEDDEEEEKPSWYGYGLDAIIGRLFNIKIDKKFQTMDWRWRPKDKEDLYFDAKSKTSVTWKECVTYAALDAVLTYEVAQVQVPRINEYKMVKHYKLLKDMQHVIADMEINGFRLDTKKHDVLIKEWTALQKKQSLECAKYFYLKDKHGIPREMNLNSTKQLAVWAVDHYPADVIADWTRTKKGALAFGKSALAFKQKLPEIKALLDFKKTAKLLSTYGETLQDQINPVTKRIHCSFSLGETRTGRLSSRAPNLQNLPRDSNMRNIFCSSPGKTLLVADFNQIELRVAGELSRDPVILDAYKTGKDLHSVFASKMFSIPVKSVTKEQRQIAKSANFGAIYGMGATKFVTYTLASTGGDVHLSQDEAKLTIDTLWELYSVYGRWCKNVREEAELTGFVRTPMGKVRKLHPKEVYTKAPNTKVQGGAFEVMGAAMIELRRLLNEINTDRYNPVAELVNSVHDEVIVEVDKKQAKKVKELVEKAMVKGMLTVFPKAVTNGLAVAKICDSWGEGK